MDGVFAASIDDCDDLDDMYKRLMPAADDYRELISSMGGYSGYRVFFSESEMRAHTVFWKTNSGFTDKDGNALYYNDNVIDENGEEGYVDRRLDGYDFIKGTSRTERYGIRIGNFFNELSAKYAKTLKKLPDNKVRYYNYR